jgi:hypothetical protein
MTEKRKEQRSRTLFSAKILLPGRHAVIDCVVRDLSASGARIKVDEVAIVPVEFDLVIAAPSGERRQRCRVIWRRPTEIGVAFD